jgi:hypothetical protein
MSLTYCNKCGERPEMVQETQAPPEQTGEQPAASAATKWKTKNAAEDRKGGPQGQESERTGRRLGQFGQHNFISP